MVIQGNFFPPAQRSGRVMPATLRDTRLQMSHCGPANKVARSPTHATQEDRLAAVKEQEAGQKERQGASEREWKLRRDYWKRALS